MIERVVHGRNQMSSRERASGRRVLGALCLGHLAAALSFSVFAMVGMAVLDPSVPVTEPYRLMLEFASIALGLPIMVLVFMLPFSLITAPFTIVAALKLRTGPRMALAGGAAIGAAWVFWFEVTTGDLPGVWSRAGLPGDPRTLAFLVVNGAVAGTAYAWVVWSRCIRPYIDAPTPLSPSQA